MGWDPQGLSLTGAVPSGGNPGPQRIRDSGGPARLPLAPYRNKVSCYHEAVTLQFGGFGQMFPQE